MATVALLVDTGSGAVDLASTNRRLLMADDLFTAPSKRGTNPVIPYSDGELRVDKKTDAKTISVTYGLDGNDSDGKWVLGSETSYLLAEYKSLLGLLPDATATDDMSCELTCRVVYPAPTGTVDTTADAEFLRTVFAKDPDSPRRALVTVEFRLLTGAFS